MANFDDNPFAGDSENPFAVSIRSLNEYLLRLSSYGLLSSGRSIPGSRPF